MHAIIYTTWLLQIGFKRIVINGLKVDTDTATYTSITSILTVGCQSWSCYPHKVRTRNKYVHY